MPWQIKLKVESQTRSKLWNTYIFIVLVSEIFSGPLSSNDIAKNVIQLFAKVTRNWRFSGNPIEAADYWTLPNSKIKRIVITRSTKTRGIILATKVFHAIKSHKGTFDQTKGQQTFRQLWNVMEYRKILMKGIQNSAKAW